MSSEPKRISVRRNGSSMGQVIIMPESMDVLVLKAEEVVRMKIKRIYNSSGDMISSADVIRDGDTIIVGGDEPFIPEPAPPRAESSTVKSFEEFKKCKTSTEYRVASKRKRGRGDDKDDEDTIVNSGIMEPRGSLLKPLWGKRLPVKVKKKSTYMLLLDEIRKKWILFHSNLIDENEEYILVYQDATYALFLPGEGKEFFCLSKYRQRLGKDYQRITFFLCKQRDFDFVNDKNRETNNEDFPAEVASKSVEPNPMPVPSTSRGTVDTTLDGDFAYASLFQMEEWSDEMSESGDIDTANNNKPDVNQQEAITIDQILKTLSSQIDTESISKFNISRSNVIDGLQRGLKRKSFSPQNKISVKFMDDEGAAEGAVDQGGPMREMLSLSVKYFLTSQLFEGEFDRKYLTCINNSLEKDEYFTAGQILALSIVHGGPAPRSLSEIFFDGLVYGANKTAPTITDISEHSTVGIALSTLNSMDICHTSTIPDDIETILELAGTRYRIQSNEDKKKVISDTAKWYIFRKARAAIEQFEEGLETLGVFNAMKKYPDQFKPLFCGGKQLLSSESFSNKTNVRFLRSERDSNKFLTENNTLAFWQDFLLDIDEGNVPDISLSNIVSFSTGCTEFIPGLKIDIGFLHDAEEDGELSKYPKANTCACKFMLPVVHKKYEDFKHHMEFGIANAKGFGYA